MRNRLADETSPYLQQHAANPVDWYPWGAEALALARASERAADPAVGRLFDLPLVPCDGARMLRRRRHRRADEPAFRQHQGRPGGATRHRPDLSDSPPVADPARERLAADDVPHPRGQALLRRHLFPEALALQPAGVRRTAAAGGAGLGRAARAAAAPRATRSFGSSAAGDSQRRPLAPQCLPRRPRLPARRAARTHAERAAARRRPALCLRPGRPDARAVRGSARGRLACPKY